MGLGETDIHPLQLHTNWLTSRVGRSHDFIGFLHFEPLHDCSSDRSHLRSSIASSVQSPVLKFPFFSPRGAPGLNPPCSRHRLRPRMAPLSAAWIVEYCQG